MRINLTAYARYILLALLPALAAHGAYAASPAPAGSSDTLSLGSVRVYGKSAAQRVREDAFTVNAVSVRPSVNHLTTLRDIVDRSAGVKVRRQGGLGSDFDLSINGLSGNSIRYFIDGIPLDTKGSAVSLDNLPLNLVERVELYKGVVPARFGADALGGAVNIVTRRARTNFLDVSYGIGSFHTHSGDLTGQWFIPGTAVAVRPTISVGYSKNDYTMKGVEVWDEDASRYVLADLPRFHDSYFSALAQLEAGVSSVDWADNFYVTASFNKVDKDLQTGAMQNKVYGCATRNSRSWSVGARYDKRWGPVAARATLTHTWDRSETVDTALRKYSWDGTWLPGSGNEINGKARAMRVYSRPLTLLNAGVDYDISQLHNLSLNYTLNRRGNKRHDKVDKTFEPTNDVVTKHILALTYAQRLLDGRLHNVAFFKEYINSTVIRQSDNFTTTGALSVPPRATKAYHGGGLGSRFLILAPLGVKASYEHSVRLPLSRELLGNGTTVYPNLALRPEASDNVNLGLFGTWIPGEGDHRFTYELDAYLRYVHDYIRANVSEREGMMQYLNEPAVHIKGLDLDLTYTWRETLTVNLNGTVDDARDRRRYKTDGNPSATFNNRVPNRPWMYANASATYEFRDIIPVLPSDRLSISLSHKYIHWYYLNWEAYGATASKARIPRQNLTDITVTCSWHEGRYNLSVGCDNIFDRLAYDNYMLQRPGRSFSAKFRLFLD